MQVEILFEAARWCGYRGPAKNGVGIYLIGAGDFQPCERLPFPLEICACCGSGIKSARGFTWINPATLFDPWTGKPECCEVMGKTIPGLAHDHASCYMCNPMGVAGEAAGLLWVGMENYKTSRLFMEEARVMGISRKIGAFPQGFELGKHVVYLAHRKTHIRNNAETGQQEWVQGVFTAFKPVRVDIVIDDPDKVPAIAIELVKRIGDAARIVKVIPIQEEGVESDGDDY